MQNSTNGTMPCTATLRASGVVLLAFLSLAVSAAAGYAQTAGTPAQLSLAGVPATVSPNEELTVRVTIAGARSLFGAEMEVLFDANAVLIIDADPTQTGVQLTLGPMLNPGFVVFNTADNSAGRIRVAFTQVAPTAPADGDGDIASFRIRGTSGGDPKLRFGPVVLARDDGTPQPFEIRTPGQTQPSTASPTAVNRPIVTIPAVQTASPGTNSAVSTQVAGTTPGIVRGASGPAGGVPSTGAPAAAADDDSALPWIALALAAVLVLGAAGGFIATRYRAKRGPGEDS